MAASTSRYLTENDLVDFTKHYQCRVSVTDTSCSRPERPNITAIAPGASGIKSGALMRRKFPGNAAVGRSNAINSITVSVAWVHFCSAAGTTFWYIGPIGGKGSLSAWRLCDPPCWRHNLELVRRGLILYTFGNASGIARQSGLVAIKPSGVPSKS